MDKAVIRIALLAPLLIALPACATVPRTGSLCTAGPIALDKADDLTRSTTEQVVALNNAGAKVCGWKPPRK